MLRFPMFQLAGMERSLLMLTDLNMFISQGARITILTPGLGVFRGRITVREVWAHLSYLILRFIEIFAEYTG